MANNLNHNCINFVQYFCGCNNYHFIVTGDNLTAKKARTFIITWLQLEPKWVYVLHYLCFLFLFHCQGQFRIFCRVILFSAPGRKCCPGRPDNLVAFFNCICVPSKSSSSDVIGVFSQTSLSTPCAETCPTSHSWRSWLELILRLVLGRASLDSETYKHGKSK